MTDELDPSDPAIVNIENDRRHRALTGIRKVISPIREEVREEQREARRAYDIAHPPAEQDAKAADAIEARIAGMLAHGHSDTSAVVMSMRADVATLRSRNDPNRPKRTTCEPVSRRRMFPLSDLHPDGAEYDPEVQDLSVTGPDRKGWQKVTTYRATAQAEIAARPEPERVRVSDLIDEHEESVLAEVEREKGAAK